MTYTATCHCGAVRLAFPSLDMGSAVRCDCSICRRRGAIMISVPVGELTVESGDSLRLYTFNTHTAEHWFCGTCGIYTHHRRRSDPLQYGVNVGCVEGIDIRAVHWEWTDGINHPSDRRGAS